MAVGTCNVLSKPAKLWNHGGPRRLGLAAPPYVGAISASSCHAPAHAMRQPMPCAPARDVCVYHATTNAT
eukprot:364817-Chlamydomonas_euryale.AAC.2